MQLAVRWCGLAAVLATSAALAASIAARSSPEKSTWTRFESHVPGSEHWTFDQPAFMRCLSAHDDRIALDYFPDGSISSISARRDTAIFRCLRREYENPHFANHVPVTEPELLGVFVPCAQAPHGEPESFGKVFADSSAELARCVPALPHRLHVEVPRIQAGTMVFDPADVPSARCIAALACGHRYQFGPESGGHGIMMSVP
ncbi:MAG: hypothetical protein HOV81_18415 [Kofleriaceae bacterium]|nr:hypothetical protein [Kofleriaceae bacterium]